MIGAVKLKDQVQRAAHDRRHRHRCTASRCCRGVTGILQRGAGGRVAVPPLLIAVLADSATS